MLAAQDVAARCKEIGVNALHIKMRATGGTGTKTIGPGGQSALRALARAGMKIGRIEVCSFGLDMFRLILMSFLLTGRYPYTLRYHSQKGWSSRSSFVGNYITSPHYVSAPHLLPHLKGVAIDRESLRKGRCWNKAVRLLHLLIPIRSVALPSIFSVKGSSMTPTPPLVSPSFFTVPAFFFDFVV